MWCWAGDVCVSVRVGGEGGTRGWNMQSTLNVQALTATRTDWIFRKKEGGEKKLKRCELGITIVKCIFYLSFVLYFFKKKSPIIFLSSLLSMILLQNFYPKLAKTLSFQFFLRTRISSDSGIVIQSRKIQKNLNFLEYVCAFSGFTPPDSPTGGLLQRHNSFSWWFSSREPTCAGSPSKNELWRCSGIWLHCLMGQPADHSWVELSIQVDYSQLVMGRSGSQADLSKANLKSRDPQIWRFHYSLLDILGESAWAHDSALLPLSPQWHNYIFHLSCWTIKGFFSWFVFSTRDQVGWAQLGTSRKGSFIVICGNYLVKHKNILFIYILLNNIHKRRINLYWTSLSS